VAFLAQRITPFIKDQADLFLGDLFCALKIVIVHAVATSFVACFCDFENEGRNGAAAAAAIAGGIKATAAPFLEQVLWRYP
jgi:hypothetical protein